MTLPTYSLLADLNDDGTFETDWTLYLKGVQGLELYRASALEAFGPRKVDLLLDNEDKRFSPKNTSGPYSPDLKRGARIQLKTKATTPAVANLVDTPSLEVDAIGWTGGSRSTEEAKHGAASFKQLGVGAAASVLVKARSGGRFAVTAGLPFTWRIQTLKTGAGAATDFRAGVTWYNGGGGIIQTDFGATIAFRSGGPWIDCIAQFTAPVGAVTAEVGGAGILSLAAGDAMFFDDAFFYQSADTTLPYCDGDQPGAVWAGTAHQSTSSRVVDPLIPLFTGTIRSFGLSRVKDPNVGPLMAISCTGNLESLHGQKLNAGPFTRKPARDVIDRLLDLMTRGQVLDNGEYQAGVLTESWVIQAGGLTTDVSSASKQGLDPAEFASLDGDFVRFFQGVNTTPSGNFDLDVNSRTTPGEDYDLVCYVATQDVNSEAGKTVKIQVIDSGGTLSDTSIVLSATGLTRVRVNNITFTGGGSGRKLRAQMMSNPAVGLNTWFITGLSLTPSIHRIDRTWPSGASKFDSDLEYLDGFERSAIAMLEEAVKSGGGWYYEDGDGGFVFEDFDALVTTAVPKLRLTDTEIEDGFYYEATDYNEPAANFYNIIRVGSYGDVSVITEGAPRTGFAFEPLPRSYAANKRVTTFAAYMGEEADGIILRGASIVDVLGAGNYDPETRPISGKTVNADKQPYVESYGRSGLVIFQTDVTLGLTLDELRVVGAAQNRTTSERTFLDKIVAGTENDMPRILELEMPAQGYKTQVMQDLADWAARYGSGLSIMTVTLSASNLEYLLEVIGRQPMLPVRVRHITGPGAFMVDELYHVQGWTYNDLPGALPTVQLLLEEAA